MKINNLDEFTKPTMPKLADLASYDLLSGYNSPITMIMSQVETKMEADTMSVIHQYGIDVNKDELIKALDYDRKQYEDGFRKGYEAGYEKAKNDLAEMIMNYPR